MIAEADAIRAASGIPRATAGFVAQDSAEPMAPTSTVREGAASEEKLETAYLLLEASLRQALAAAAMAGAREQQATASAETAWRVCARQRNGRRHEVSRARKTRACWPIRPFVRRVVRSDAVACATFKARALESPRCCWSCRQLRRDLREVGLLDEKGSDEQWRRTE